MIPEIILFLGINAFVLVMYSIGIWATHRAVDSVREMDQQDDAERRYAQIQNQIKAWTDRSKQ